jgi:Protein kinase domain
VEPTWRRHVTKARNDIRPQRPAAAAAGTLAAGTLLARRYRLLTPVSAGSVSTLWRGIDEALARPVAVRVVDRPGDAEQIGRFRAAAGSAGRICHPRIAGVYDTGQHDGADYLVTEWVGGKPLDQLLRDGALNPVAATALAYQVAQALAAAAAVGVCHGRLHPGNVLVGSGGRVKVTDFAVAAALASRGSGPSSPRAAAAGDIRALGAVLYAALTGRHPSGVASGLPAAPIRDGAICTPRQVRAGIPKALDLLVMRLLDPGRTPTLPPLGTASAALEALQPLLSESRAGTVASRADPRRLGRRPRRPVRRAVLALALILVVAGGGWFAGYQVGQLPGVARHLPARSPSTKPTPTAPGPLPVAAIRDFDPPPGDGQEQPSLVSATADGDRSTAWETDRYLGDPNLGGLKPGVGLLLDLGRPVPVGRVDVVLTIPGATVELRATPPSQSVPPTALAELPLLDQVTGAGTDLSLIARTSAPARYWLVWLTRLPADPTGGFRDGIAELTVRPPGSG